MIIFSSNKLEQALSRDALDSWQKTKYVILFMAAPALTGTLPALIHLVTPTFWQTAPTRNSLIYWCCSLPNIILIYAGARKCYLINKGADDKDFAERFFALYIPVSFEILLFVILLVIVGAVLYSYDAGTYLAHIFPRTADSISTSKNSIVYFMYIMTSVLTWLFFLMLICSFERLASLIAKREREL